MFLHIVLSLTMNNVRGFLIICNFIYFREAYHQVDSYNSALFKQITSLSNNNEEKRNNLLKLLTGISCSADAAQMDMRDFGMSEGWVSISSNEWKDWSAKQKLLILLWVYDRAIMLFFLFDFGWNMPGYETLSKIILRYTKFWRSATFQLTQSLNCFIYLRSFCGSILVYY